MKIELLRECQIGAARLSSARAVRCTLKWGNERNPCHVLHFSRETALARGRKAGTTSNQRGPYVQGDTHDTMVSTAGSQAARRSKSLKTDLSSDCSLKLDYMKLESLVKADHNAALNTFSGLVLTARHVKRVGGTRTSP